MSKKLFARIRQISPVWIAPVLALAVAGVLIWQNTIDRGPVIRVTMRNAQGIAPGKTLVKFRSVTVGTVKDLTLTPDFSHTVAVIQMNSGTDALLKRDTKFFLVNPKVSAGQITGLETVLSGAYLNLFRGDHKESATDFKLSDTEPLTNENHGGRYFTIRSEDPQKLSAGDEVTYQGVRIGQIMRIRSDLKNREIFHDIYIYKPYVDLVTENTAFYAYGGINLSLDARGINLDIDSLDRILRGGICMEHFEKQRGNPVAENHLFPLFRNRNLASIGHYSKRPSFVVMLPSSLESIGPRSKVYMKGIEIGEVTQAPWYEDENHIFSRREIPVRLSITAGDAGYITKLFADKLKKGKLCAAARASTLLTSADVIDLTLMNASSCTKPQKNTFRSLPVIPYSQTAGLKEAFSQTLEKLGKFDVEGLNKQLSGFISNADKLMKEATGTTRDFNKSGAITHLVEAIDSFRQTLKAYGTNSPLQRDVSAMIEDLRSIANSLRPVVREVQQKPNSLIFSDSSADPVPRVSTK